MSDRVGYIAGNTAGRDHINWPTILRSQIATLFPPLTDDEGWPVDVTLEQVMALVWRVKKWRLTGSWSASINYVAPLQTISGSATAEFATDTFLSVLCARGGESLAIRESDLVFTVLNETYRALVNNGVGHLITNAPVLDWGLTFTFPPSAATGSTPVSGSGAIAIRIFNGFYLFDPDTKLFAPPFQIAAGINIPPGAGTNTPGFIIEVYPKRTPATVAAGTGPLLLKAPGTMTIKPLIASEIVVPLQLAWRLPGEAPGSSLSGTGEAAFVLEAVEFWPYSTSRNEPVYDINSGAQLRDPFE